ncbi:MAG: transcriptional repressor LexA [Firmicutes bacterium]|jgi:repressor LexA|nr:transcriptional repressor LexA [Bacillota bacterium]
MERNLTTKRKEILNFIAKEIQSRGYPPSVREIGDAVGLSSTSTVHSHLKVLQEDGYLFRDPTKPRAMGIKLEESEKAQSENQYFVDVPLVGSVAAGVGVLAQENIEETYQLPKNLLGNGIHFMLRVRGESMTGSGIFPGDLLIIRQDVEVHSGDIVVAGIPGDEATVKTLRKSGSKIILLPSNPEYAEMIFNPSEVTLYGKVVSVFRQL